ncbi:MAG: DUF47 domain-containing protein [Candidatus Moduliflexus flocculans]|nr:DUF47 domain-containing protein [Candidatus Moduliflexus flocculans]
MGIINLRQSKALEGQIDDHLDTISRASLVFRNGIKEYLDGEIGRFEETIAEMARLENRADELRRSIESRLYLHSLIPEMRGDVLGLLESMDAVINSEKKTLLQFSVEMPAIPAELGPGFPRPGRCEHERRRGDGDGGPRLFPRLQHGQELPAQGLLPRKGGGQDQRQAQAPDLRLRARSEPQDPPALFRPAHREHLGLRRGRRRPPDDQHHQAQLLNPGPA